MELRYNCDHLIGVAGTRRLSESTALLLDQTALEQGEECPLRVGA